AQNSAANAGHCFDSCWKSRPGPVPKFARSAAEQRTRPSLNTSRKPDGLAEYFVNSAGIKGLALRALKLAWNNPASAVSAGAVSAGGLPPTQSPPGPSRLPSPVFRAQRGRSVAPPGTPFFL